MDIARLNLLRELADRGSVTEVARATHQTVSGVSQQLRRLEAEAGLPLTQKVGRGLGLTDAGRALAKSASDMALAFARAEAEWDEFRNNPTGSVTLATFPTGGQMFLPGLLERADRVGGLVVHCSDRDPDAEGFAALTSDFDIVLAHAMRPAAGARDLTVVPLMVEPLVIALPADHGLADREYLVPGDLVGERWIGNPWGYPFEPMLNEVSSEAGAPLDIVQRFADTRVTEALVAAGRGIAGLPSYTAAEAYRGRIVLKTLRGVAAERHIFILMRPERAERLAVRTVVGLLLDEAAAIVERASLANEQLANERDRT